MASLPQLPQQTLLNTPTPSEPADKWASNTLEAVTDEQGRVQDRPDAPQSTVSTPGFPGAFPRAPGTSTAQDDVSYVKDAAYSAFSTAKDYVGSAGETVGQYIPASVTAYLPASLSPNKSQSDTDAASPSDNNGLANVSGESLAKLPEERLQEKLPSHDDETSTPLGKTRGVGPLPGNASEEGVAVLPDQKHKDIDQPQVTESPSAFNTAKDGTRDTQPSQSYLNPDWTPAHDATALPLDDKQESGSHRNPGPLSSRPSTAPTADTDASTQTLLGSHINAGTPPSHDSKLETFREHDEQQPKDGPAAVMISSLHKKHEGSQDTRCLDGSVPTVSSSAGKGYDSKAQGVSPNKNINTSPRTHPLGSSNGTFNGVSLAESEQKRLDANEDEQLNVMKPAHGKLVGASVPESKKGTDLEINSPRNEPPPVPEKVETKRFDSTTATTGHGSTAGIASIPSGQSRHLERDQSESGSTVDKQNSASGSPPKKSGFMNKVKGEMKILSGKLSHNEEKIVEGKQMMGRN